ncbi:GNAT family N-acetyltransferase [Chitinophaga rhizophila]|uniref:N-acetyltransferase n=1 Tax=Chitinophaga rhizophila TaxID=2866212 RepID=A0ABS7G502_9BACT|nr:GNAT family N-acetyltransferase [Chitinophaga rhizophila]MBW8682735.1 N-acetyltransferase [Chitinophaga rhizophila]
MDEVVIRLNAKNHGAFYLMHEGEQTGEMVIAVDGGVLTAYHTEIIPQAEGKGLARVLLNGMVAYAREHQLKVRPLCAYVHAQFKKHPDEYADIWLKQEGE